MAPALQQEELATKTTMMHNRTAEQSVEEGLANSLSSFANLLTVPLSGISIQIEALGILTNDL